MISFDSKYDGEVIFEYMRKSLEKCDDDTVKIFDMVMADHKERFISEFAAHSHHDNCKSGLAAHTCKVLKFINLICGIYKNIFSDKEKISLVCLGTVLHDIGKIQEYTNGSVIGNGQIVSHHTFGVEILGKYKEQIINLKSEEFYYRLLAIIEQHHGEWGERPRTIEAFVVHMADNLDASLTLIDQQLEGAEHGIEIQIDGYRLH